jgi:hypothetical protein
VTGLFGRRSRKQIMTNTLWNQAMKSRRLAAQAKQAVQQHVAALEKLKAEEQTELARLAAPLPPAAVPITRVEIAPRKSDVDVDDVQLVWLPWHTNQDGTITPAYSLSLHSTPNA